MIQLDLGRVTAKTANFGTRLYSAAATNVYTKSLVYNLMLKQAIRLGLVGVPPTTKHTSKFYF